MAWERLPVQVDRLIRVEDAQEVWHALIERAHVVDRNIAGTNAWTTISAIERPNSENYSKGAYWKSLQDAVNLLINTGLFYWVESYTDLRTHSIWKLVLGNTDSGTIPKQKNAFELALGPGVTSWRHPFAFAKGRLPRAEAVNDLRLVLNVLNKSLTYWDRIASDAGCMRGRQIYAYPEWCSREELYSILDAAPWGAYPYTYPARYYLSAISNDTGPPFFTNGIRAHQGQVAHFFHYPIPSARIGFSEYTSINGVARYKPLLNFRWSVACNSFTTYKPILRQADVLVRYANGGTPYPTSITDARIWGSASTGFSFAPGSLHVSEMLNLWPEINQPFAAGEAIRVGFVIGAGMDPICVGIYGPEYENAFELVYMENNTIFDDELLCEWSFDKLG